MYFSFVFFLYFGSDQRKWEGKQQKRKLKHVGEGSSWPSVLLGGPPLLSLDMLLATRGGLET
jgi:hypothetical protein